MFKRLRQLRISLAAKCQILFGAAVILIIAASLAVPWRRMEQLTRQVDERAAESLADRAIDHHLAMHQRGSESADDPEDDSPATRPATTLPTRHNAKAFRAIVKLVGVGSSEPRFAVNAMALFNRRTDRTPFSSYTDGVSIYRYAQPLGLNQECQSCHSVDSAGALMNISEAFVPEAQTRPAAIGATTAPADEVDSAKATHGRRWPLAGTVIVEMPTRIDANQLLLNRVFILSAGLFAGTLAIITFYLITTRLILQPVRVLQETAEKVSRGDLNIRSDISTGDEFQQLSETFNTMLANLKLSTDQLRSINKSLDLKLGQLAESNLALFESNRLKSEFLANVSHELRTPLNSILGFAELLKDTLSAPQEVKTTRYVSNILQSSKHLLDLINDLLDLAKIEAGRMEIRAEPLSLPDLFEGLGNLLRPIWERKTLTVNATVEPDVPIIHTDPAKLQQVLYNFLSNAIKFSPEHGEVGLLAELDIDREHVRISVTDRGPGIDPDKQGIIFEKFRQVDASHTRSHGGTGLGLAISKELAAILGGSIGVRSAQGEGATFWVLLPLKIQSGTADVRGRLVWS